MDWFLYGNGLRHERVKWEIWNIVWKLWAENYKIKPTVEVVRGVLMLFWKEFEISIKAEMSKLLIDDLK